MMNKTIKKSSLADEVAQHLQEQISLGTYKPGDKLPIEPALMEEFGVGRSTIREAVRILANSGVLRVQQGLGTFVEANQGIAEPFPQRLKRATFEDLDEVRELLEMKIAQKAAANRTDADIAKIEQLHKEKKAAIAVNDLAGTIQADINFHIAIAEASGNSILTDLYKTLSAHMHTHWLQNFKTVDSFRETMQLHKNLLNSIIAGDTQKAWQWVLRITQYKEKDNK